jgi:hypothetical protein
MRSAGRGERSSRKLQNIFRIGMNDNIEAQRLVARLGKPAYCKMHRLYVGFHPCLSLPRQCHILENQRTQSR